MPLSATAEPAHAAAPAADKRPPGLPEGVPSYAEKIEHVHCWVIERQPSRFVPTVTAIVPKHICPGCRVEREELEIGKTVACDCGLKSHRIEIGGVLVWKEQP